MKVLIDENKLDKMKKYIEDIYCSSSPLEELMGDWTEPEIKNALKILSHNNKQDFAFAIFYMFKELVDNGTIQITLEQGIYPLDGSEIEDKDLTKCNFKPYDAEGSKWFAHSDSETFKNDLTFQLKYK